MSDAVFLPDRFLEGHDLEAKLVQGRDGRGALPQSFWETDSAFANTGRGGATTADGETPPREIMTPPRALRTPPRVGYDTTSVGEAGKGVGETAPDCHPNSPQSPAAFRRNDFGPLQKAGLLKDGFSSSPNHENQPSRPIEGGP
jgi:hypothetical protein